MGGGGFLGLGPAPSAPAAPDYSGAARETAAGNVEAARVATAANRINQVTPYGSLTYTQSGTDPYGNPTYTATQALSPDQQRLLETQNRIRDLVNGPVAPVIPFRETITICDPFGTGDDIVSVVPEIVYSFGS